MGKTQWQLARWVSTLGQGGIGAYLTKGWGKEPCWKQPMCRPRTNRVWWGLLAVKDKGRHPGMCCSAPCVCWPEMDTVSLTGMGNWAISSLDPIPISLSYHSIQYCTCTKRIIYQRKKYIYIFRLSTNIFTVQAWIKIFFINTRLMLRKNVLKESGCSSARICWLVVWGNDKQYWRRRNKKTLRFWVSRDKVILDWVYFLSYKIRTWTTMM